MSKIIISGMHCVSCAKLIQMELDEHNLGQFIQTLSDEGELLLNKDASDEDIQKIKTIINGMEGYSVSEE